MQSHISVSQWNLTVPLVLSFPVNNLLWGGPVMPPPSSCPALAPPPDGGWGWAVVLGSFISIGFSYAFPKAITVFFKDIQLIFNASYSQVAWISSIMLAVMYAAGKLSWSSRIFSKWRKAKNSKFKFLFKSYLVLEIFTKCCSKETDWRMFYGLAHKYSWCAWQPISKKQLLLFSKWLKTTS